MKNIHFTSDSHMGHGNIIKYANRLFAMNDTEREICISGDNKRYKELKLSQESIRKHDRILIDNWNKAVKPDDDVYHLGDFCFGRTAYIHNILNQLNGRIHLIYGNHDREIRENIELQERFAWCKEYYELEITDSDSIRGRQLIILIHYAMRVWNKSHHGSWNFYGHSHSSLTDDPNAKSVDIGIDNIANLLSLNNIRLAEDYRPISYDEGKKLMNKKQWKPVDHHDSNSTRNLDLPLPHKNYTK